MSVRFSEEWAAFQKRGGTVTLSDFRLLDAIPPPLRGGYKFWNCVASFAILTALWYAISGNWGYCVSCFGGAIVLTRTINSTMRGQIIHLASKDYDYFDRCYAVGWIAVKQG